MKNRLVSNFDFRFKLAIELIENDERVLRYFVKLIDSENDSDRANDLWIIEAINDSTYQLTYEQLIARELVMFGSLAECLNQIKSECDKRIERLAK